VKENEQLNDSRRLTDDELTGQMTYVFYSFFPMRNFVWGLIHTLNSVLIFGAQDTTSSALSRIIFMLSRHPDIQGQLRDEILEALQANGSDGSFGAGNSADFDSYLGYEEITKLPLLDAVVKETLRLCVFGIWLAQAVTKAQFHIVQIPASTLRSPNVSA
jgi:hypothetical protein